MKEYLDESQIEHLKALNEIDKASMLVSIVFQDKIDKAGETYIRHLYKVSESFKEEKEKVVALLHDIVEDTSFTFLDLEELGFSKKVIDTLKLLTNDLENYDTYINRLLNSDNDLAKKVKMADLLDNMNLNRLSKVSQVDLDRINNKYIKTYIKLIEDLERRIKND